MMTLESVGAVLTVDPMRRRRGQARRVSSRSLTAGSPVSSPQNLQCEVCQRSFPQGSASQLVCHAVYRNPNRHRTLGRMGVGKALEVYDEALGR